MLDIPAQIMSWRKRATTLTELAAFLDRSRRGEVTQERVRLLVQVIGGKRCAYVRLVAAAARRIDNEIEMSARDRADEPFARGVVLQVSDFCCWIGHCVFSSQ